MPASSTRTSPWVRVVPATSIDPDTGATIVSEPIERARDDLGAGGAVEEHEHRPARSARRRDPRPCGGPGRYRPTRSDVSKPPSRWGGSSDPSSSRSPVRPDTGPACRCPGTRAAASCAGATSRGDLGLHRPDGEAPAVREHDDAVAPFRDPTRSCRSRTARRRRGTGTDPARRCPGPCWWCPAPRCASCRWRGHGRRTTASARRWARRSSARRRVRSARRRSGSEAPSPPCPRPSRSASVEVEVDVTVGRAHGFVRQDAVHGRLLSTTAQAVPRP